jgi:hypothetical protein
MGEQFQKINKEQGVFSFKKEAAKLEAVWQSLEVATEYLAREMKEFIDSNSVDVIISDEAGGRIPSLIMWEIMRLVHPDNGPELKFLSAGRKKVDKEQIERFSLTGKQALVVTECIEYGKSVGYIGQSFLDLKIKKPALCSFFIYIPGIVKELKTLFDPVFLVPTDLPDSDLGDFVDLHARLSGVIKDDKLNVVALANKNVNFPSHKYFSFVDAFYDINAFNKRPLTLNERKELQEVVNESRKRTKQIASRVYTKVWLKEA